MFGLTIAPKETAIWDYKRQYRFKKLSKFQKKFYCDLVKRGEMNCIQSDDLVQRTTAKAKNLGQTYIKKHLN